MKYVTEGCLYLRKYSWEDTWTVDFGPEGMDEPSDPCAATYVKVRAHTLTIDVPDNIDLVTPQVDAIRKQMAEIRAKSEAALTEMQGRINSLLAIEHKVTA